jgi:hypothetical protein
MFRRNVPPGVTQAAQRAAAAGHPAGSGLPPQKPPPEVAARSCCCPARPQVKVIIPASAARPCPVDLWLCGHHYRASQAALAEAGAAVQTLG